MSNRRAPKRHGIPGQGLAEYALVLALIAIVAIIALIFLGGGSTYRQDVPAGAKVVWTGHHGGYDSRVVATDEGGIFCSIQQDFHPATKVWVSGERVCSPPPTTDG
jgi:Flp pilus assembly pilin Flp